MARKPMTSTTNDENRPIREGISNRGGINQNPSSMLTRPAPPQPYKPSSSTDSGSAPNSESKS